MVLEIQTFNIDTATLYQVRSQVELPTCPCILYLRPIDKGPMYTYIYVWHGHPQGTPLDLSKLMNFLILESFWMRRTLGSILTSILSVSHFGESFLRLMLLPIFMISDIS